MSKGLLILGGAALLLMSGKKKTKPSKGNGTNGNGAIDDGSNVNGDDTNGDDTNGDDTNGSGARGSSSTGGKSHSSKGQAAGGIWVSADCKLIEYENGDPEAWWNRRGKEAAQNFIDANYHDPYEVARAIIVQVAPCAVEFPVMEDGFDPSDEEYGREQFLRNFKDAYYLIQWLYNAIAELMDSEEYTIEIDDTCNVVFVGDEWLNLNAKRMARFYMDYMYPEPSSPEGYNEKAWEGADPTEKNLTFSDNIALAIINRMHPTCAWEILDAFQKDPREAKGFFGTRPDAKAAYEMLIAKVNDVEDHRHLDPSEPFDPMS